MLNAKFPNLPSQFLNNKISKYLFCNTLYINRIFKLQNSTLITYGATEFCNLNILFM